MLTGERPELLSSMLAMGLIPADYDLGDLRIDPATFVGEFVDLSKAPTAEDYMDMLESQLEALLAPLSDPGLYLKQVEDFAHDLWFLDDLSDEDLLLAIELLQEERDISTTLSTARDHLRLI